jgi:hypothetical protein
MAEDRIEAVARAFYGAQDCARGWNQEPEWLKERFRGYAQTGLTTFDEQTRLVQEDPADRLRSVPDQDRQT